MEEVPQGFNPGLPDPRAAWCHGAWLHPEGTGRHVCCLGKAARPASGLLAQACRPLQLGLCGALVARELRPGSPRWLCPSVGPARLFQPAEPQLHKGCLDTAGPAGPLLHRRKTSIDQGPPRVPPFFPAFLRGQEIFWWQLAGYKGDPRLPPEGCIGTKA